MNLKDVFWVPFSDGEGFPRASVHAGFEYDGDPVIVARAYLDGALIPGKYVDRWSLAYIPAEDGKKLVCKNLRSYEVNFTLQSQKIARISEST